jgi:hypothetical protein
VSNCSWLQRIAIAYFIIKTFYSIKFN